MLAELICHQLPVHVDIVTIAQTIRNFIELVLLPQLQNPLKAFFGHPPIYSYLFIKVIKHCIRDTYFTTSWVQINIYSVFKRQVREKLSNVL